MKIKLEHTEFGIVPKKKSIFGGYCPITNIEFETEDECLRWISGTYMQMLGNAPGITYEKTSTIYKVNPIRR